MSTQVSNDFIIEQLTKAAAVIEVSDTSLQKSFRVRAYQTAIDSLSNLDEDIKSILDRHELETIEGIGPELNKKISDLVNLGHSSSLDKLFSLVPQAMFTLLQIPGIGPKKAFYLSKSLHLSDPVKAVSMLKRACQGGQVARLEGFGEKSQADILANLSRLKPKSTRLHLHQANTIASNLITLLKPLQEVKKVDILGSLRRKCDTIGDIDLAVKTNYPNTVLEQLRQNKDISLELSGKNVVRVILPKNIQADIKFQTPGKYGATLQHFTGSKNHNIALREYGLKQGKSLSEHGIKFKSHLNTFAAEEDFYQDLGLDWIPPELRENRGEIESAHNHTLPCLLDTEDIRGDLHTHTNYPWLSSHDKGVPIEDILDIALQKHYFWICLGDHNLSQSSYTQNSMVNEVNKRTHYIEQIYNSWKYNVKHRTLYILNCLEVDILPDGSLAMPDKALSKLDFLIVSIHSRFNLPQKTQTQRLLKALNHPKVKIIGHPTGRLIGDRPPMNIDWPSIYSYCLSKNIALEINANPHRLDLPDGLVRDALKKGVKCAIGSDAHHKTSLNDLAYGVAVARRGWAQKSDIINTYTYSDLLTWIKS